MITITTQMCLSLGYNVQMGVMDEYIMNIFINTDANDMNSFQATIEKYNEMYRKYPNSVCADAGYGSKKNYRYCASHDIKAYWIVNTFSDNYLENSYVGLTHLHILTFNQSEILT